MACPSHRTEQPCEPAHPPEPSPSVGRRQFGYWLSTYKSHSLRSAGPSSSGPKRERLGSGQDLDWQKGQISSLALEQELARVAGPPSSSTPAVPNAVSTNKTGRPRHSDTELLMLAAGFYLNEYGR